MQINKFYIKDMVFSLIVLYTYNRILCVRYNYYGNVNERSVGDNSDKLIFNCK